MNEINKLTLELCQADYVELCQLVSQLRRKSKSQFLRELIREKAVVLAPYYIKEGYRSYISRSGAADRLEAGEPVEWDRYEIVKSEDGKILYHTVDERLAAEKSAHDLDYEFWSAKLNHPRDHGVTMDGADKRNSQVSKEEEGHDGDDEGAK